MMMDRVKDRVGDRDMVRDRVGVGLEL